MVKKRRIAGQLDSNNENECSRRENPVCSAQKIVYFGENVVNEKKVLIPWDNMMSIWNQYRHKMFGCVRRTKNISQQYIYQLRIYL
jgi:hypothetical protein